MAANSTITVKNPENGDVRVVPAALEQRYTDRGFEKVAAKNKGKAGTAESSK